MNLTLKSKRVLLNGELKPASIVVRDGKISEIRDYSFSPPGDKKEIIDASDNVIMPGIVDTHAHINEPGRTDWEGFQSATRAAAAGGITTVIDMPLNSIPATISLSALRVKAETAEGKCLINYGFWGGVVPGNQDELVRMVEEGALGFKAFLIDSGVDEFPMSSEADLKIAMPILAQAGVPLLVHAELDSSESPKPPSVGQPISRNYEDYLKSRPGKWELDAIRMMIRLAHETGCRTHIVHLSNAEALKDIRNARAKGIPISTETCPHYLFFESEKIPDGATQFKCAPPIRNHANREALWKGLISSEIDFIVSDHSPCIPKLKSLELGDFMKAWGGISGLQFSLSVVWTEMKRRGLGIPQLSQWMSANTALMIGLEDRKGKIAPGFDADLVVWDPDHSLIVDHLPIYHRHSLTPYAGHEFFGVVHKTFVNGKLVYNDGEFSSPPEGKQITGQTIGNEKS